MQLSRRHFFFGSLALPVFGATKPAAARPNVLLILVDNLPSWALGSSGNKDFRTPNLDRFAQTGTKFLNHAVCTPAPGLSRATILTGRTPMQLGDAETPTAGSGSLESILSAAGYQTRSANSASAGQALEQMAADKPFLLTVDCPSLLPPYEGVAQKYHDLYAQTKFDTLNAQRAAAANALHGKEIFSDLAGNLRKVAAAITSLDDDMAGILTKISQRKLLDNTVIVFTSTCGALLGRHGLWGAGAASDPVNMYQEAVATPLFWAWPGHIPAQGVRPEMVSTYDILPTVCELAGAPAPAGTLCGRSYVLPLSGKPLPKKQPWRTTTFGHYQGTDMARVERYKLVTRNQGKGPGELYDLVLDPVEAVNQYENPQFMTIRAPMADHLATWKQKYS